MLSSCSSMLGMGSSPKRPLMADAGKPTMVSSSHYPRSPSLCGNLSGRELASPERRRRYADQGLVITVCLDRRGVQIAGPPGQLANVSRVIVIIVASSLSALSAARTGLGYRRARERFAGFYHCRDGIFRIRRGRFGRADCRSQRAAGCSA